MEATGRENEKYLKNNRLIILALYLITFAVYAVTIFIKNPTSHRFVGIANVLLVIT
jgi:hypothetical protein